MRESKWWCGRTDRKSKSDERIGMKYVKREQLRRERERKRGGNSGSAPAVGSWKRTVCGALLIWWPDDDGVDDSPLVGNQKEERIIITQLNYSAISPWQRQALQGSSLKLIWEACGVLEDQWTTQQRSETSPLEEGEDEKAGEDNRGEEAWEHTGIKRVRRQRRKRVQTWRSERRRPRELCSWRMWRSVAEQEGQTGSKCTSDAENTCSVMSMSSPAGPGGLTWILKSSYSCGALSVL